MTKRVYDKIAAGLTEALAVATEEAAPAPALPLLTPAQRRALLWLPVDGGWRDKPGRMVQALNSLSISHPALICSAWSPIDDAYHHRLTRAGVEARKQIEREGG